MSQVFYAEKLPSLIGQEFRMPRAYGHARYVIVGGHDAWHSTRDALKVYLRGAEGDGDLVCIAVVRTGGYSGAGEEIPLLQELTGLIPCPN